MSRQGSRLSLAWLALLELAAIATTAVVYVLELADRAYWYAVLAGTVAAAAVLFLAARWIVGRSATRERPGANNKGKGRPESRDGKGDEYLAAGRQLLREERWAEAAKMFQEAIARNARNWQAYNYLGRAHAARGQFEEAREAYERAIGLEYNYASAHFNLATAHEKLGELEKAMDRWRHYLEVGQTIGENPDWLEHARQRIVAIEKRLGRREAGGDDEQAWDDDIPADDGEDR